MRRISHPKLTVFAAVAWIGFAAHPAAASTLCVGNGSGCYATIQAALRAAHDGDSIEIGRGTFPGGVHITKSVRLIGSGASRTTIRGGRSVITIGRFGAASEPTVAISGVTITGGVTHSSPESVAFTGKPNVFAAGGGIEIPPNADFSGGATVTITDSVISGNRVEPLATARIGPQCPDGACPFAGAFGGGIDSWGTLTLVHSVVEHNIAHGVASDADGGGIVSQLAGLTLLHTVVRENQAVATPPNGRFAEGGGLYVNGGALRLENVTVSGNSARMTTSYPAFAGTELIDMNANSGGVHVSDNVPTVVDRTVISRNTVVAIGRKAEPNSFDAGMLVGDSPLVMRDSVISRNRVTDVSLTQVDIGPQGSAFDTDGGTASISHVRVLDNTAVLLSKHGVALAAGGFSVLGSSNHAFRRVTLSDSVVQGNVAIARSGSGVAVARGGGVFSNGLLTLRRVSVVGNRAIAAAPSAAEQGGGIWSGPLLTGPPVQLTLLDSTVARNVLPPGTGIARRGGGLFTIAPHTIRRTTFSGNVPGACFGCAASAAAVPASPLRVRGTRSRSLTGWPR